MGTAINYAARVMSAGDENHILLSASYYGSFVRDQDGWRDRCHPVGDMTAKHGVDIGIVNVHWDKYGNSMRPSGMKSSEE